VWAGTLTSGVSKFKDGKFVTYTTADGLASNTVSAILDTRDGTVWFATPNGLSALSRGHWTTYATEDGLPSNSVNCLFEDSAGVLWIERREDWPSSNRGASKFLAILRSRCAKRRLECRKTRRDGFDRDFRSRIARVKSEAIEWSLKARPRFASMGRDGLPNAKGVKRSRSVVADSQGRIWFSTSRGRVGCRPISYHEQCYSSSASRRGIMADNDPITVGELVSNSVFS